MTAYRVLVKIKTKRDKTRRYIMLPDNQLEKEIHFSLVVVTTTDSLKDVENVVNTTLVGRPYTMDPDWMPNLIVAKTEIIQCDKLSDLVFIQNKESEEKL